MRKWEGKTILVDLMQEDADRVLNQMGAEGWELVSVNHLGTGAYRLWFKRLLPLPVKVKKPPEQPAVAVG